MEQARSTEEQSEAALWITAMITLQHGKVHGTGHCSGRCRVHCMAGERNAREVQQVAYCVCEEEMALVAGELYRFQAGHVGNKVNQERTLQTRLVACPGVKNRRKVEESVMPVVLTDRLMLDIVLDLVVSAKNFYRFPFLVSWSCSLQT